MSNYYYMTPKGDGNRFLDRHRVIEVDYYYITPKGDGNSCLSSYIFRIRITTT